MQNMTLEADRQNCTYVCVAKYNEMQASNGYIVGGGSPCRYNCPKVIASKQSLKSSLSGSCKVKRMHFLVYFFHWKKSSQKLTRREPWSSCYGRRLTFKRSWVRIPAPDTRCPFFTFICCKYCIICLFEKTENKRKEAGNGPF